MDSQQAFLAGKLAAVTGGTRGIGRAIAEALARHGARVAICGRDPGATGRAAVELAAAAGGEVVGTGCDVRDQDSVGAFFRFIDRELGGLDIFVNNAGIGIFRPVAELDAGDWRRVIETNLSGVFYCSREAIPRLKARGGGALIQIGSLAGKNPFAGGAAYNATKFGLIGFDEAMMLDHRYDGIRVSTILPGSVDTDFSPRSGRAEWKIQPEDIAEIVLMILRMPARTMVSHVEVRPSQPRKG